MQSNLYKILYGFCEGYFGRDDYKDKIIILEGATWIVLRYLDKDAVESLNFDSPKEKQEFIDRNCRDNVFGEDD